MSKAGREGRQEMLGAMEAPVVLSASNVESLGTRLLTVGREVQGSRLKGMVAVKLSASFVGWRAIRLPPAQKRKGAQEGANVKKIHHVKLVQQVRLPWKEEWKILSSKGGLMEEELVWC